MDDIKESKTFRLVRRDRDIIAHVKWFRLTTVQVLKRLFFADGSTDNAVVKVTLRLRQAGYLVAHELYGPYCYFVPGPAANPSDKHAGTPLRGQTLVTSYAMLMLCCMSESKKVFVPHRDLASAFTS